MRKILRSVAAALTAATMLAVMTACSAEEKPKETKQEVTVSSEDKDKIMSEINGGLADYIGRPTFVAGAFSTIDAKKILSGKRLFLICVDSTNDYMLGMTERYKDLVVCCGGDVFVYYADGTADTMITGMQTAIAEKYDAIDLVGGTTVSALDSVIAEAHAAGIYVQDVHSGDITTKFSDDASVGADFQKAQELLCYEAIREIGDPAKVNALVVADIGLDATDNPSRQGVKNVFDRYGIKYKIADVAITDWTTAIAEQVRTALITDPTINVIIAYYDNMLLYVTPVIEELGINNDDIVIGSYNGTPGIIDMIKSGSVDFDLGESVGWIGAHGFDCLLRGLSGETVHTEIGTALYMINKENIDSYLDPVSGKATYAFDGVTDIYLEGYSKLWGVDVTSAFKNADK